MKKIIYLIFLSTLLSEGTSASKEMPSGPPKSLLPGVGRVALIPLMNYSGNPEAAKTIPPALHEQIERQGIEIVKTDSLRMILRRFKIRGAAHVNKMNAKKLKNSLNVSHLIIGSIDVYEESQISEISISLRLVDADNMIICWANTASVSDEDQTGVFKIWKASSVSSLVQKAVNRLFENINIEYIESRIMIAHDVITVGIIPFENLTSNLHAHNIMANILLARVFGPSVKIIEPGELQHFFRNNLIMPRGEIDLHSLDGIYKLYRPDYILTGSLDKFQLGKGARDRYNPAIEFSIKILNPEAGKIVGIWHAESRGSDWEGLFQLGREFSLINLAHRQAHDIFEKTPLSNHINRGL